MRSKAEMITFRVNKAQKKAIHKLLEDIKKKNRYTYPEIITASLRIYQGRLHEEIY